MKKYRVTYDIKRNRQEYAREMIVEAKNLKDAREQFETRTHKRVIDILKPSQKVVEALMGIDLPAGVEIEVKL